MQGPGNLEQEQSMLWGARIPQREARHGNIDGTRTSAANCPDLRSGRGALPASGISCAIQGVAALGHLASRRKNKKAQEWHPHAFRKCRWSSVLDSDSCKNKVTIPMQASGIRHELPNVLCPCVHELLFLAAVAGYFGEGQTQAKA